MANSFIQTPRPHRASESEQQELSPKQYQLSSESGQRNKNAIFGLGITEVILGSTSIALGVSALVIRSKEKDLNDSLECLYPIFYTLISSGIWCGAFAVVTGILGIVLKKKPTRVINILNITMSIFTALVMPSGIALSGLAAVASIFCSTALAVVQAADALLCFILFIISIVHSAMCCSGVSYEKH